MQLKKVKPIKKVTTLSVFLLLVFSSISQAQWVNRGPGGQALSSVSFYNANYGFACGSAGSLYRTSDGGVTWRLLQNFQTPGLLNSLRAVVQPTLTTVLTIFEIQGGPQPTALYRSDNSGNLFTYVDEGAYVNMSYRNPEVGIQVGEAGTLRYDRAGGQVWVSVPSGTQKTLRDSDCPTNQDCYVVGDDGTVRRNLTADLFSWRALNSTTSARLNGVWFTTADAGYIVGNNGTALRTVNGGVNWTPMPVNTSVNFNDVRFLNRTTGFIVGDFGTILLTTDAGLTWQSETTNTFENLASIAATADEASIWVAGGNGTVLKRGRVVLGTPKPIEAGAWQAYPNPFEGEILIDVPPIVEGRVQVRLLDAIGRQVLQQDLAQQAGQRGHKLSVPTTLPSGVYWLQLLQEGKPPEVRRLVRLQ